MWGKHLGEETTCGGKDWIPLKQPFGATKIFEHGDAKFCFKKIYMKQHLGTAHKNVYIPTLNCTL